MKKFLNILGIVAIVATLLAGCVKEPAESAFVNSKKRIITVTANLDEASRTVLGDSGKCVEWDERDYENMQLIVGTLDNNDWDELFRVNAYEMEINTDNGTAEFHFALTEKQAGDADAAAELECLCLRAIMVYNNKDVGYGEPDEYYIKNTQDPTATSFDPRADLLIAKQQAPLTKMPTSISFDFARAVALNKLAIRGLDANADIRSISFITYEGDENGENPGTPFVGQIKPYYDEAGNGWFTLDDGRDSYDNHRVTMSYDDELAVGGKFDAYFVTAPMTLQEGKTLTIRIVTTDKYYEKAVNLKKDYEFKLNTLNVLPVNMTDCVYNNAPTYELITDVNNLNVGDNIIITSLDSKVGISTTQSNKNRSKADIAANALTDTSVAVNADVQRITLVAGETEGTFAFRVTGDQTGYLCSVSGQNQLLTQTVGAPNATSSWWISINETSHAASIYSFPANNETRYLKYNSSSSLFACYTGGQQNVKIYRELTTPVVKAPSPQIISKAQGEYTIYYTVTAGIDDFEVIGIDGCVNAAIAGEGNVIVSVDENTTGAPRHGDVIIASHNHPDVTVKLPVIQSNVVAADLYTLTLTKDDFLTDSYTANNGDHVFTATSNNGSCKVKLNIANIYQNNSAIQFKAAGEGCMYNKTALTNIHTITVAYNSSDTNPDAPLIATCGQEPNPNENNIVPDNGVYADFTYPYFALNTGAKYKLVDTITIVFEDADASTLEPLETPVISGATLNLTGNLTAAWNTNSYAASYDWALYAEGNNSAIASGNVATNSLNTTVDATITAGNYTLRVKAKPAEDSEDWSESAWSEPKAITASADKLSTPTISSASLTLDGKLTAAWTGDTNAASYSWVLRNSSDTDIANGTANGTSMTDTNVGTTITAGDYSLVIKANAASSTYADSDWSSPKSIKVLPAGVEDNTKTDTITADMLAATKSNYEDFSGVNKDTSNNIKSNAVYAGNNAKNTSDNANAIQLRKSKLTGNTPQAASGIVTTASGGKVKKITITWNTNTTAGRVLDIYASNTPYTAASDLYESSTQGTKVANLSYSAETEYTFEGDYKYIGICSNSGTIYLDEIKIYWEPSEGDNDDETTQLTTPTLNTPTVNGKEVTISWNAVTNAASYEVTCGTSTQTVTTTSATFEMPEYSTPYDVSVVAKPAEGSTEYLQSATATTTVTTGADPNAGSGSGEENSDPINIELNLASNDTYPAGFPTAKGTTATWTGILGGYQFTMNGAISGSDGGVYKNSSNSSSIYLMIGKCSTTINCNIVFPAIEGYKLTSVTIGTTKDSSTSVKISVRDSSNNIIAGGTEWTVEGDKEHTYSLTATTTNTAYKLYLIATSGSRNTQLKKLNLTYTPAN